MYSKLLCLLHGCLATCRYAVIQHALQHTPHFHLFSSDLVILFSPVMEGCSCSGLVCFVSSRMQSGKGKKKKDSHNTQSYLRRPLPIHTGKSGVKCWRFNAESSLTSFCVVYSIVFNYIHLCLSAISCLVQLRVWSTNEPWNFRNCKAFLLAFEAVVLGPRRICMYVTVWQRRLHCTCMFSARTTLILVFSNLAQYCFNGFSML